MIIIRSSHHDHILPARLVSELCPVFCFPFLCMCLSVCLSVCPLRNGEKLRMSNWCDLVVICVMVNLVIKVTFNVDLWPSRHSIINMSSPEYSLIVNVYMHSNQIAVNSVKYWYTKSIPSSLNRKLHDESFCRIWVVIVCSKVQV